MQILPEGLVPRNEDETPSTEHATDSVAAILETFDSVATSEVPVIVQGNGTPDAAAALPVSLDAAVGTAPALTRRELRERERAAEAAAATRAATPGATTPVAPTSASAAVASATPATVDATGSAAASSDVPGSAATGSAAAGSAATVEAPSRPARPLLFDSVPDAAAATSAAPSRRASRASAPQTSSPRIEKVARIKKQKGVKARSLRLASSTHPAGKPAVAAALTAVGPTAARAKVQSVKRTILKNLVSVGAMAGVGLILISTTVPANAFSRPDTSIEAQASTSSTATSTAKTQELEVAAVAAPTVVRDNFTVTSLQQQLAARGGNRLLTYTNDSAGSIQWPFPDGSPITSGFGSRSVSGCGFCSTYHEGLDFTPGLGTPIHAIADGVVSDVQTSGAFGNHVMIDHIVNGQKVQSLYAHMQYGSIKVSVGQVVTVGQEIGAVGSTGASTGPHLHLEIHLDGTPVDPFAWLQANAN